MSADELKAQIDRLEAKILHVEEHLNDLVMRIPFEGTVLSFRRTRGGQFRIYLADKPAANCSAEQKIYVATHINQFQDEYLGHLQNMVDRARSIE